MKPPYSITSEITALIASISEQLGMIKVGNLIPLSTQLRKQNQIKTIHSSLSIEGNTITEAQMTALLEGKRVIGPAQEIQEVKNAIHVYEHIETFQFDSLSSFQKAHQQLMNGLLKYPGEFRTKDVGIAKGNEIQHMAPPALNVRSLMKDLFSYLKNDPEISLIKSCVFHYELEFIHPFEDGNERMGRMWQKLILMQNHPIFAHIPFETLIAESQSNYYEALALSDKSGNSTAFIRFILGIIHEHLQIITGQSYPITRTQEERIDYFCQIRNAPFQRKDYLEVFRNISNATASRDLKLGVELGLFIMKGDKRLARYRINKP